MTQNDLDLEMTLKIVKNENIFLKTHFLTFKAENLQIDALNNLRNHAFYRT